MMFLHSDVNSGSVTLGPLDFEQMKALYDGELRHLDARLGELWQGLETMGLADETLFVFTSDHGEAFDDHPKQRVWHGRAYETNQRVPLILRLRKRLPARKVDVLVRTVDIYPTILELAGIGSLQRINGESLLPLIERGGKDRGYIGGTARLDQVFLRNDRYKLIYSRRTDETEVYDLLADPQEQNNIAPQHPALAKSLKDEFWRSVEATKIEVAGAGEGEISAAELERLRALGYAE